MPHRHNSGGGIVSEQPVCLNLKGEGQGLGFSWIQQPRLYPAESVLVRVWFQGRHYDPTFELALPACIQAQ